MSDQKAQEMPEGWKVFPDGGIENRLGDSFEWVNDGVTVGVRRAATHYFTELPIEVLRALLSAHGLAIVTEADRKVLEAMAEIPEESMSWAQAISHSLDAALEAELEARKTREK